MMVPDPWPTRRTTTGTACDTAEDAKSPGSVATDSGADDHIREKESVIDMASIAPTPDARHTARMAHVDGCPECVHNYEPPRSVIAQDDGFTAAYHCGSCGHYWLTNWADTI